MPKSLVVFSLLAVCVILAGVNRGFDFSDEGLYLLLTHPFQENKGGLFLYDLFFKLLYKLFGIEFGIIDLRLIRFVSIFLAATALGYFWKNLKKESKLSTRLFLVSFLALLSGYSFLPSTLSYNSLTVMFTCFWLAFISKQDLKIQDFIALGGTLVFLGYIKLPAAVGLLVLSPGLMGECPSGAWKLLVSLLIPLFVLESLFYFFFEDGLIIRTLTFLSKDTLRDSYTWGFLMKNTLVGFFWCLLVSGVFWFYGNVPKSSGKLKKSLGLAAALVFIIISFFTHITDEWNHLILLISSASLGWGMGNGKLILAHREKTFFLLLLFLPFALHFGSNVYWLRLGIHYWVFWILAILLIEKNKLFRIAPVYGGLCFLLVLNGIWISPFEQEPLWKASEDWEYRPGKVIKLSREQKKILLNIRLTLRDYHDRELLSIYRNPGMAYLSGYTVPKSPGFWEKAELDFYFGDNGFPSVILYSPIDSLPETILKNYKQKSLGSYQSSEVRLLWK